MSSKAPSEKHLEDYIYEKRMFTYKTSVPEPDAWEQFYLPNYLERQVRIRGYIADLIAVDKIGVEVIELKKNDLKWGDLFQLRRYMSMMNDVWFDTQQLSVSALDEEMRIAELIKAAKQARTKTRGMLIGYSFPCDDFVFIASALGITVLTYEYTPGHYKFTQARTENPSRKESSYQIDSDDAFIMQLFDAVDYLKGTINDGGHHGT